MDQYAIILTLLFIFVILVIIASNKQKGYKKKEIELKTNNLDDQDRRTLSDKEIDDYVEIVEREFLRNKQIIQESLEIMSDTNNPTTLLSRWGEVVYIDTLIKHNAEKYDISLEDYDPEFLSKLDDYVNFHLIRIFENKKEDYALRIWKLQRISAIDNHTTLILNDILVNKELLRPSRNKVDCEKALDNVYYDIQELYSQRTNNLKA